MLRFHSISLFAAAAASVRPRSQPPRALPVPRTPPHHPSNYPGFGARHGHDSVTKKARFGHAFRVPAISLTL